MNLRARCFVAICAVALTAGVALPAAAQDVRVSFASGRVTIAANNATIADILREWSRAGGSTFVNAEKLPSTERLTLRIENELETRALAVLLRSAAGYIVGGRKPQMTGPSGIGNVLIMPVSNAAAFASAEPAQIPDATGDAPLVPVAPPRPDDDGPTLRQTPPPYPGTQPSGPVTQPGPMGAGAPIGQANPLQGTTTQTVPGLGAVTSSQPGAVIPNARPGGRIPLTPTQPVQRPGGGG